MLRFLNRRNFTLALGLVVVIIILISTSMMASSNNTKKAESNTPSAKTEFSLKKIKQAIFNL